MLLWELWKEAVLWNFGMGVWGKQTYGLKTACISGRISIVGCGSPKENPKPRSGAVMRVSCLPPRSLHVFQENDMATTHGETRGGKKSAEYRAWCTISKKMGSYTDSKSTNYMKQRVIVCDRWVNSFPNFLEDMGRRPSLFHEFRRKNPSLGYFKENCHWVSTLSKWE